MLNPMFIALLLAAQPEPGAVETTQASMAVTDEGDDELICRRRSVDSGRIGERNRTMRVCKTREEWEEDRRGRRAG